MNQQLVCIIDLFDQEQQVYHQREDGKMVLLCSTNLPELDRTLIEFCKAEKVNKVHLYGQELYIYEIKASMLQYARNEYGFENEIEIEVN